jgi:hypothetical protein
VSGPTHAGLGRFRVHYPDGSTKDVRLTSKAVVEAERRWPGIEVDGSDRYRPNEGVHYMVWITLGSPHGDFDEWLDEGFVLEPIEDKEPVDAADPTQPEAGAGSSRNSARPRASRRVNSTAPKQKVS